MYQFVYSFLGCLFASPMSSLVKCLFNFLSIYYWVMYFILLSFAYPLYILDTSVLSYMCIANIFSQCALILQSLKSRIFKLKSTIHHFFLKCLEPISPPFFAVWLSVFYSTPAMLRQVVYSFASVFTFCSYRASRSTWSKRLGSSRFSWEYK